VQVGDLVRMRGGLPEIGVVLRTNPEGYQHRYGRVEVHWIEDSETTWEPVKWLKVVSSS